MVSNYFRAKNKSRSYFTAGKKTILFWGGQASIFLYDLTNTVFEGQQQVTPKVLHNKNQNEKRSDYPQVHKDIYEKREIEKEI